MCLICDRIQMIKDEANPFFVKELETGYVVLGDTQRIKGYTLFLCKKHETELFDLDEDFAAKYYERNDFCGQSRQKCLLRGQDKLRVFRARRRPSSLASFSET